MHHATHTLTLDSSQNPLEASYKVYMHHATHTLTLDSSQNHLEAS